MKVLSKDKVATKNLQRYALTERNVMSVINHPFMAKLFFAFQNSSKLFLVMDYYPGGDLGKLISRKKNLPE
jgi:serine/threonine protein kinase